MEQLVEFAGNNMLLAGAWVALFVMLIYSYVTGFTSPVKEVSTHEMTVLVNKEDAVILDTRAQKDFKAGHIVGSRQLSAEAIRSNDFKKLENVKDKPIIVVCAMGNSARAVANSMSKAGFDNVKVLRGGMSAWTSAGLPVSK